MGVFAVESFGPPLIIFGIDKCVVVKGIRGGLLLDILLRLETLLSSTDE